MKEWRCNMRTEAEIYKRAGELIEKIQNEWDDKCSDDENLSASAGELMRLLELGWVLGIVKK